MKTCNEILGRTLQLTDMMIELADMGDGARKDVGCGVLYGLLRDSAYKIRKVAGQEKENHISRGLWPEEKKSVKAKIAIPKKASPPAPSLVIDRSWKASGMSGRLPRSAM
ncbi:MAG TPA: hypothetical protein HPP81_11900 [Deltaproteobacteria bacterium]|jgi:hypothetical protein|nr:hypothetical protein [Deltaproteobacteria bacterium]